MNDLFWIGNASLNLSFFFYLIVYIPQIIHNRKTHHLVQLSLWLHLYLFLSYSFDLVYGFASHLPWQYKTVSIVGLVLIFIQHLQLLQLFMNEKRPALVKKWLVLLIINTLAIAYVFIIKHGSLSPQNTLIVGIIARACGLVYSLPQIIKNTSLKTSNAISKQFIYVNLTITLLDSISAWCLKWGWPNKIASPISALLMLTLLFQQRQKAKTDWVDILPALKSRGNPRLFRARRMSIIK